jgi:hypothetical protein
MKMGIEAKKLGRVEYCDGRTKENSCAVDRAADSRYARLGVIPRMNDFSR